MKVRLLAFATAADALGAEERELELPDGATVRDLRERLAAEHPALAELWARTAVAVDGELAAGDAAIRDGAEVALLPPVSGGRAPAVALVEEPLDPATVAAAVSGPDCGAVVLFVGTVRDHHLGHAVERLTYTAYRGMAERRLAAIAEELQEAHAARVAVAHRLGDLVPGEASVVIAAAAPHREAAYRASRDCLERLKREVPIWKREHYGDGTARWREEEPLVAGAAPGPAPSPTD
jgi:molybdopterin synthase catalytic subunit